MLFAVFSFLDVVAGAAIYSYKIFSFLSWAAALLAVIILAKGAYSILTALAANYYYDWAGALDVIAGASLFLLAFGVIGPQHLIGGLAIGKGAYYLTRSILGI